MDNYRKLAQKFGLADYHNELKKALTHKSFYNNVENDGSSRYVFLGMYGFKGKASEILFNYIPATGTQLQHYLGNLFKNDYLLRIYNKYEFDDVIRYGNNFDNSTHKHIFVYGLLGFLTKYATTEFLQKFIVSNFLTNSEHLLPSEYHNRDMYAQCNLLALQTYNKPISIEVIKQENAIFQATVKTGTVVLSIAESASYKYVRKKAIKLALLKITEQLSNDLENNPEYVQRQKLKAKAEQAEKERINAEKLQQQKIKQLQKKEEREKRKKERQAITQNKKKQLSKTKS